MISKARVSRWVMYIGLLAFAGALIGGNPASAMVAALLVLQYVALQAYKGYTNSPEEPEPEPEPPDRPTETET